MDYKIDQVAFTIPEDSFKGGGSSPLNRIFNSKGLTEGSSDFICFKDALKISCIVSKNETVTLEESEEIVDSENGEATEEITDTSFIYGIKVEWMNGSYKGEKIETIVWNTTENIVENTTENTTEVIFNFNSINDKFLFTDVKELVSFQISLFKKGEETGTVTYDTPFLSFDTVGNSFDFVDKPSIYTNGLIPQLSPSNKIQQVDFLKQKAMDFELIDLRASSISAVPIYGFKAKASLTADGANAVLCDEKYFWQLQGEELVNLKPDIEKIKVEEQEGEEEEKIINYISLIKSPLPSTDLPSESGNYVVFKPKILDDATFLKTLFNINSLTYLDTVKEFYYIITVVDIFGQESEGYIFKVGYDFGITPYLHTNPEVTKYDYPIVTIDDEEAWAFCDGNKDTNEFDYVLFEWFPAVNPNDVLRSPEKYYKAADGKYYLLTDKEDLTDYYLYKWKDNKYTSQVFSSGADNFRAFEDTIEGHTVVKYQGKYAMSLKNKTSSELVNFSIVPYYKEKVANAQLTEEDTNIVKSDGTKQNFLICRFTEPNTKYSTHYREPSDDRKKYGFTITIDNTDWGGVLDINGSSFFEKNNPLTFTDIYTGNIKIELVSDFSTKIDFNETWNYYFYTKEENENKIWDKEWSGGYNEILYDFSDAFTDLMQESGESSKDSYSALDLDSISVKSIITTTINHKYFSYDIDNDTKKWIIVKKPNESSFSHKFTYFINAGFATLSLRKNKVGINMSNMTRVEEALYVVAKDRIDADNVSSNIASYDNLTFPHVMSIQGNSNSQMPNFNKKTGEFIKSEKNSSTYLGLYNITKQGKTIRLGSFGIEDGYPCIVYKGKYYNDSAGVENKDFTKGEDHKNYFEKINLINALPPVGTIVMYPYKNFNFGEAVPSLHIINNCWFVCNGAKIENDEQKYYELITILGGTTLPDIEPTDAKNFVYIIKGDC